jgi:transcription initiation factor IIE alpha subunit
MNARQAGAWRDVLTALQARGGTVEEIADHSGWSEDHTRRCLHALVSSGYAVRHPDPSCHYRYIYRATNRKMPVKFRMRQDIPPTAAWLDAKIADSVVTPKTALQIATEAGSYRQLVRSRLYVMESLGEVERVAGTRPTQWRLVRRPERLNTLDRVAGMLDRTNRCALDIAATLRIPADEVRKALRKLQDDGIAVQAGRGGRGATLWRAASPAR